MPRRNRQRRKRSYWLEDNVKPAGKKRPRKWHRGPGQDALYEKALEQLDDRGEQAA